MKKLFVLLTLVSLLCCTGCGPEITPIQRKEAANLVSEAQFAVTLRDWARAEELLRKATELCPDNAEYWLNLGMARRRQDNSPGARKAYEKSAEAYGAAYKASSPRDPQNLMQQIYVYSLLGQPKNAQKVLKQAHADHADNPSVRNFTEQTLERMVNDPGFKALAL